MSSRFITEKVRPYTLGAGVRSVPMIYFARRYAYNQKGAWHVGDGPAPEKVTTGTTMICGYVIGQGGHQTRPIHSATEAGVMTLCGRCIEALGMRKP